MMMTQQVPAMCYVPWQRWDELYEPSRAIMRGTMFPVLDKPFMIMKNIYELGFALVETMLYLDTHPDDAAAIEYYAEIKDKYVQFMKKYSDYYGPLSMEYMVNDNYWMWVATPMPWEYKGGM